MSRKNFLIGTFGSRGCCMLIIYSLGSLCLLDISHTFQELLKQYKISFTTKSYSVGSGLSSFLTINGNSSTKHNALFWAFSHAELWKCPGILKYPTNSSTFKQNSPSNFTIDLMWATKFWNHNSIRCWQVTKLPAW